MNDAVFRNGEPVYVDSSGYFATPSGAAFGTLPGNLKERRSPDGAIELVLTRQSFLTSLITGLIVGGLFFTVTWAIGQAGSEHARFWMTIAAAVVGSLVLLLVIIGSFMYPLSGYNPAVRWDPKEQVLSFDAGRVKLAKSEIRSLCFERRSVRYYHNSDATFTSVRALWIKVEQGEYVTLPMGLLSGANTRVVREFLNALPISATVK